MSVNGSQFDVDMSTEDQPSSLRTVPISFDSITRQSVEGATTPLDSGASSYADQERMSVEPLTFVKDSVEGLAAGTSGASPPKKRRRMKIDDGEYQPPGTRRVSL